MKWLVWLLGLGLVVVLTTVECVYQATLAQVPEFPPCPEGASTPPVHGRLRWALLEGSTTPRVDIIWPGTIVRVLVSAASSERPPSMPAGLRLADEVARSWSARMHQENGRHLRAFERLALAIWLTRHWSVEELLAFDAEHTYLLQDLVGMRAGAQVLLGKDWAQLDATGMALLIAVSEAPGKSRDPWCFPAEMRSRRDRLLKQIQAKGGLTMTETEAALRAPLGLAVRPAHWRPCGTE
ncbi:transglycosylase domain-containing protein [Myxococcus sp. RHSTA-1-4]|uniref:transglycosylase domain-containing protein n=1 Tax=Myxococcus sp. RHSTA-1-4 TaxID=2874601 RepID=UPI001CC1B847|nr:transglycosylase domain-containing protein [Myxococcus sp. RHSTA-1-4]MBZ4421634.1 transglycosylase domain-containing protein [Myxococcus sp. RHSTA-1-4]